MTKKTISFATIIALLFSTAFAPALALAQIVAPSNLLPASAREFYVGRELGKPLVTVNLLNGVTTPGVYHIPYDTNLAQLLAYAGGASERADLREVTVRHTESGKLFVSEVNLEKALKESKDLYQMRDQDIVQIEQKFSAEKSMQWIGIVSSIASVVLSFYLVKDIERRNQ